MSQSETGVTWTLVSDTSTVTLDFSEEEARELIEKFEQELRTRVRGGTDR